MGMKVQSLVGLLADPIFHCWFVQCTVCMLLSDRLFSYCATGTNGCLDLRHRAFALGRQVNAEWSRCLDCMAQCAIDSGSIVMKLSRLGACEMGRLSAGAGCRHLVTI